MFLSADEYNKIRTDISQAIIISYDDLVSGYETASTCPIERLHQSHNMDAIKKAVNELPSRLKAIINMYYFQDIPMLKIGDALGVTEGRVSQLHAEALIRIKDIMPECVFGE